MRPKNMTPSAGELLGKKLSKNKRAVGLGNLKDILGERTPKIDMTRVGRVRLSRALRDRFGPTYKNLEVTQNILKEFDAEYSRMQVLRENFKSNKKEVNNG